MACRFQDEVSSHEYTDQSLYAYDSEDGGEGYESEEIISEHEHGVSDAKRSSEESSPELSNEELDPESTKRPRVETPVNCRGFKSVCSSAPPKPTARNQISKPLSVNHTPKSTRKLVQSTRLDMGGSNVNGDHTKTLSHVLGNITNLLGNVIERLESKLDSMERKLNTPSSSSSFGSDRKRRVSPVVRVSSSIQCQLSNAKCTGLRISVYESHLNRILTFPVFQFHSNAA